jgi:RNA polymerase sigma factor (sigma-70 family)
MTALTATQELSLARRMERGDAAARHELIERNLPLVRSLAAPYLHSGVPFDDLVQEGTLGLVAAIDRFDHRRGLRLSTYATWWIRRSLHDAVAAERAIRIPPAARRQISALRRAEDELRTRSGGAVSAEAIAQRAGLSPGRVRTLRAAQRVSASLEAPAGDHRAPLAERVADDAPAVGDRTERQDTAREVRAMLEVLPGRQREVLARRYGLQGHRVHTHAEIGARMGMGQERSRQIERQALHRLRQLGDRACAPRRLTA